ncbi:MAG: hypothetical protein HYZ73_03170, partial [Elusimicrobia bacterium]|nr:hypothetical protein [Elusimicrobiota bacterium]
MEKDGLLAAVIMTEIAAHAKAHGKTLYQFLNDEVYLNPEIGYFATTPLALEFENSPIGQGQKIQAIQNVLELARRVVHGEAVTIAGERVKGVTTFVPRDQKYADPKNFPVANYSDLMETLSDENLKKDPSKIRSFFPEEGVRFFFDTPKTGVHHLTIRPSGTENKLRFYVQWTAGKGLSEENVTKRRLQIDRTARGVTLD